MTTALILFAHGARDPEWASPMRRVQAAIRKRLGGVQVELAFLEFMAPSAQPTPDVSGLIASIARNAEAGGLRKYLEAYRWKVLADYVRPAKHARGEL